MFKTLVCDYLSIKSQTDFIFYIDIALDLPKHLWCWVDKTLSCLENIYLDIAWSLLWKLLENLENLKLQNLEKTCAAVSFLIKLQAESLQLYQKETMEHVFSCEFCEFFKSTYIAKHLEMVASVYYQANINIRKSLLTYSTV